MEQLETMNNNVLIRQKHGDIKIQILDHNRPEAALRVSFLLCASRLQGGDAVGHLGASLTSNCLVSHCGFSLKCF